MLVSISKAKKTPKCTTPFQPRHFTDYGLAPAEKHPVTGEIVSVECKFCVAGGHEEKIEYKKKLTLNTKYYMGPFRTKLYKDHLVHCHPTKWNK